MGELRKTKQKELLKNIVDKYTSFFNAEQLHLDALKVDSSIGIATVYRYLKMKSESGDLHSYICDRKHVYSKNKTHCHFIDEETGETFHFNIDSIDFIKGKIKADISSISIEVKGKKLN